MTRSGQRASSARHRLRRARPRDRGVARRRTTGRISTCAAFPRNCTTARSAFPAPCATPFTRIATRYATIFVAYGDCGTGGALDAVLREENVERIPGAHCYEFFAGSETFAALADDEPGTFYLTDFLLRHFDRLVIRGLGLDRHPELAPQYFGNYRRLVYLAQVDSARAHRRRARGRRTARTRVRVPRHRLRRTGAQPPRDRRCACPHGKADRHFLARRAVAGRRQAGPRHGPRAALGALPGSRRPCGDARRQGQVGRLHRRLEARRAARLRRRPEGRGDRRSRPDRSAVHRRRPRAAHPREGPRGAARRAGTAGRRRARRRRP